MYGHDFPWRANVKYVRHLEPALHAPFFCSSPLTLNVTGPSSPRSATVPPAASSRRRWFDRQMKALEGFEVTVTCCYTPEHLGVAAHHTSPPREVEGFADFCAATARRYA